VYACHIIIDSTYPFVLYNVNVTVKEVATAYKATAYKATAYKATAYKATAYKATAYKATAYKATAFSIAERTQVGWGG